MVIGKAYASCLFTVVFFIISFLNRFKKLMVVGCSKDFKVFLLLI